ncbi:hypothetical protein DL766_004686 [Monosporascus sp. MC13-8B]|uniref:6-phosphogluconolactonase n=1 Tax=Monosporascus cannonballus TaxID=155416 RepID=A0ABY0H6Y5_9PEZI|nr:hypothetical protein DL762_006220 [Monosporascus cannonballus]RYP30859.1 hypothetical protein DL766_004686 [Monosporascus sp. MC13-8B]
MLLNSLSAGLLSLLLATPSSAVLLWATSYNDHTVTSLNLKGRELKTVAKSTDCGSEPTWLTLNKGQSVLYCLNEGWGGASSITSYRTLADGTLETLDVLPVLKSPVSSTLYGPNKSGLAIAHYDTSTFSTFSVGDVRELALAQNETYTLAKPGPVPDRQSVPHLHDAILDPTGKFILSPDLGADLVRVYAVKPDSIEWTELDPVKAAPGSGPRHGAFAVAGKRTFFYLLNELSNTITGYRVTYKAGSALEFVRIFDVSSHGPGGSVPKGTLAAEIEVSPDQRFVLISSRFENSLTIPNFDKANSTRLPSDPIVSFKIDRSGALELVQEAPAGGRNPRGFSLNRAGTLVASALQDDNRVVIIERDVRSGRLGKIVAWATVGEGQGNGPSYVLFNE